MSNIRKKFVAFIAALILMTVVFWPSPSLPREQSNIKGVGFASMENFSFDSKLWDHHFSRLAKESYLFKYSSFRQIAAKLQTRNMYPFGLELPPQGKKIAPTNKEAVREFHSRFNKEVDDFLHSLALANNAALVVFDYIEKMDVELYIKGETDHLMIRIMVFYLDSGAIGINHIELDKDCFNEKFVDYPEIKSRVHTKILEALEDAVTNTRGLITESFGVSSEHERKEIGENSSTDYGEEPDKKGKSRENSGEESDVIDDSYLSDQEKTSFWE